MDNEKLRELLNKIRSYRGFVFLPETLKNDTLLYDSLSTFRVGQFLSGYGLDRLGKDNDDEGSVFKRVFSVMNIFLPQSACFYYMFESESKRFELFYSDSTDPLMVSSIETAIEEGVLELLTQKKSLQCTENIYYELSRQYMYVVPLYWQKKRIGALIALNGAKQTVSPQFSELFIQFIEEIVPTIQIMQLQQQLDKKQKNLDTLIDVTENLTYSDTIELNIKRIVEALENAISSKYVGLILLGKDQKPYFKFVSSSLFDMIRKQRWTIGEDLFSEAISKNISFAINDLSKGKKYRELYRILDERINAILIYPIKSVKFQGCLFVARTQDEGVFTHDDYNILQTIVKNMSIFISNITLFTELKTSYEQTTISLAYAIEAKDPYTKGHSQRVMRYALLIGKNLGLDESSLKIIKLAAILHDVGKIGVSEQIILKKGPLTDREFSTMKRHPYIGYNITKNISHLQKGLPFILYHHEKLDGSGYPFGLKGEQIPLFARISSVADTFDAMTSDRPYRKGLSFADAVKELVKYNDIVFDKEVVKALVKGLKT